MMAFAVALAQPASAKGSAIAVCTKHQFHSFYQNSKSAKAAASSARADCTKIGIQKFQMSEKDAKECCKSGQSISNGCIALAIGQSSKAWGFYLERSKWRIPTVLKALKRCNKDYFDCQVKAATCVGNK